MMRLRPVKIWTFPNDELGNIAANIVKLYVAREKSHRLAMDTEREKIRLKKQLTNNINHELKTPLASITILGEALRDHPEMPEPSAASARIVYLRQCRAPQ